MTHHTAALAACALTAPLAHAVFLAPAPGALQSTVFTAAADSAPPEEFVLFGPDFSSLVPADVARTAAVGGVTATAHAAGTIALAPDTLTLQIDAEANADQPFIDADASGSYVINFVLDRAATVHLFGSASSDGTAVGNGGAFNLGLTAIDPDLGPLFEFSTTAADNGAFDFTATLQPGSYFLFAVAAADLDGADPLASHTSLALTFTIPAPAAAAPQALLLLTLARRRRR